MTHLLSLSLSLSLSLFPLAFELLTARNQEIPIALPDQMIVI